MPGPERGLPALAGPAPLGGPDSWKSRSFPTLTWGNHRAGVSGFPRWERPGEATGPAPFFPLYLQIATELLGAQPLLHSLATKENQ